MCNAAAMLGTQAFGGAMSTVGAIFGAMSQKSSLQYQAQMAELNARIAEGNARNIISAGIVEESRVKLAGSLAKASQRNQMAASGIDIAGSNTAIARLTSTDVITEVDANTMRSNALRAAWGQRFEAGDQRAKATMARASAASISPALSGFTTLLSEGSKVAASWYGLEKQGAFDKSPQLPGGDVSTELWPELGMDSTLTANANKLALSRGSGTFGGSMYGLSGRPPGGSVTIAGLGY